MDQIISIGSIGSGLSTDKTSKTQDTQKNVPSFKDTLSSFMHQVMTAVEEASTAFNMMMEIRNKVMDAYQEVLRMRL